MGSMSQETFRVRVPGGTVLELSEGDAVVVGRDEGCDLVLDDPEVSRRHACLRVTGGALEVEDLGSSTGVRVDGEEVERIALSPGARLRIGGKELVVDGGEGALAEELLGTLAALVAGEGEPEVLLEGMLRGLLEALRADRAALYRPGEGGDLDLHAMVVRKGGDVGREVPVSRTLLARARCRDAAEPLLLTSDAADELRDEVESVHGVLRSMLAAAMPVGEERGVLYLDSALARRRFGVAETRLLRAFAATAGAALLRDRDYRRERRRVRQLAEVIRRRDAGRELVGESPAMKELRSQVARVGDSDVAVLVTGETGTGKELVARAIHQVSSRSGGPMVAVNCAAIPQELFEAQFFGHEAGAFSGAESERMGFLELADGGTLFLDEVGEMPQGVQAKLLRVLEERAVRRVGAEETRPVDFRLVSATHQDLEEEVAAGRFREDLYYRLRVYPLEIPPLRDRAGDLLPLARALLASLGEQYHIPVEDLEPEAAAVLAGHGWPGNVRELRNVLEFALVREPGTVLRARAVARALGTPAPAGGGGRAIAEYPRRIEDARRDFERAFLRHHLAELQGNVKATSEAIGLARRNLYVKCRDLGIDIEAFR